MKVILFGATGMVGQGVLHECLLDPDVQTILLVGQIPAEVRDHYRASGPRHDQDRQTAFPKPVLENSDINLV